MLNFSVGNTSYVKNTLQPFYQWNGEYLETQKSIEELNSQGPRARGIIAANGFCSGNPKLSKILPKCLDLKTGQDNPFSK